MDMEGSNGLLGMFIMVILLRSFEFSSFYFLGTSLTLTFFIPYRVMQKVMDSRFMLMVVDPMECFNNRKKMDGSNRSITSLQTVNKPLIK